MRFVFILTFRTESGPRYEPDPNPQLLPSVPRNQSLVPGLSDHRTNPDAASPSHATLSSGPRSLSPNHGSEHPAQPPQTKRLLPPPRPYIGPETTSSSQEFLTGAQAAVQRLSSSDTQQHAPAPDVGKEEAKHEEEKEQPLSSSPFSSWTAAARSLSARSPSPQFAPLRLTDRPPAASVQADSLLR